MTKHRSEVASGLSRKEFLSISTVATSALVAAPAMAAADRSAARLSTVEQAHRQHLSSPQVDILDRIGLKLIYGERRGARIRDAISGRWFWDCHRLGSTYNVGHSHPAVIAALRDGLRDLEIGNFMTLAEQRTRLAARLAATTDNRLPGIIYTASGAEANEAAMKAARVFTGRRAFVAFEGGYHGDTLSTLAVGGDNQKRRLYGLGDFPVTFVTFNDIDAFRKAVTDSTAALIGEPTVAQLGFPEPASGFWEMAAEHCRSVGAQIILDEVQTGGGATGTFWHYEQLGFVPDILVTGKWPSGGYFPNSFALLRSDIHEAVTRDVFMPHPSTFGGSELGCLVSNRVLDILDRPAVLARVRTLSARFARGFADAPFSLNRNGLCMALIDRRLINFESVRLLAEQGVLTVPALHHPHAVEFRPVLTISDGEADQIISAVRAALG
jgi:putrescine aminotransferase